MRCGGGRMRSGHAPVKAPAKAPVNGAVNRAVKVPVAGPAKAADSSYPSVTGRSFPR